jgi:hypothetical protein
LDDDDEYYRDWDEEIERFHDKIQSLYNTEDAQWSHTSDNDSAGSGVGAEDTGAADCAETEHTTMRWNQKLLWMIKVVYGRHFRR